MIYVMSDIHGNLNSFNLMLNKIKFSEEDTLYVIGDMIDRGDSPIALLEKCLTIENIVPLMGNHERMMLEYFEDRSLTGWLINGGERTLDQLLTIKEEYRNSLLSQVSRLPIYKALKVNNKKFLLVHAGMETDNSGNILKIQDEDFMLYAREDFYKKTLVSDPYTVIFGHTPTKYINNDSRIWHGKNMICVDCGSVYEGQLGCLRLDDMEEFYV